MELRRVAWAGIIGVVWTIAIPLVGYAAEPILIIRPLENSQIEVQSPDYEFEVEVSAFEPLMDVKINGESQPFEQGQDWVVVKRQLQLAEGKNVVEVQASTASDAASRTFKLFYDPQGKGHARLDAARKFTLVAAAGGEYASNPARIDGGKSALKAFGLFLPRYFHPLDDSTAAQVDGLIYRDKFLDSDFETLEAALTEVKVAWVEAINKTDNQRFGAGYSFSSNQFDNPLQYKFDQQSDLFLFASRRASLDESSWYEVGGELRAISYKGGTNTSVIKGSGRLAQPLGTYSGIFEASLELEQGKDIGITTVEGIAALDTPLSSYMDASEEVNKWEVGPSARLRLRTIKDGGDETRIIVALHAKRPISDTVQFVAKLAYEDQSGSSAKYTNMVLSGTFVMALY